MNIKGQGHSLTLVQVHSDSTFANFFSLEMTWDMEAKFHVEPPWDREKQICSNGSGHITNMASMPINHGKNLKNLLPWNRKADESMTMKVGKHHQVLKYLCMGKKVNQWIFSETIVVYDIKRCNQLNEYMNI